jgi:hypothetical protein
MVARLGLAPHNAPSSEPRRPDPVTHAGSTSTVAAERPWPAVAVVLLIQTRPGARLWGLSRVVLGEFGVRSVPGLRFARALGSGRNAGFGLVPSLQHQGLFALFDDDEAADAFLDRSKPMAAYRAHAAALWSAKLRATSCRGSWSGMQIAVTRQANPDTPVAALTRASIRPSRAWSFWRHAPPSQADLAHAQGCRLAVGLGEAPLLRQATFSLWDNAAAMDAYARRGAHQRAIAASQGGDFFSESMFVRFEASRIEGRWPAGAHA